ncbi:hypothetical protein ZWY2020_006611 [Hordeum vulgare]|nr:hypothetical protein ZWY2020_006611 [Hordeum vulgare]
MSSDTSSSGDVRWRVSFAAVLGARSLLFNDSEVLLRRDALRLVLLDALGVTIDARFLRAAEAFDIGDVVGFPYYFAKVRDRLLTAIFVPASGSTDRGCGAATHRGHTGV